MLVKTVKSRYDLCPLGLELNFAEQGSQKIPKFEKIGEIIWNIHLIRLDGYLRYPL